MKNKPPLELYPELPAELEHWVDGPALPDNVVHVVPDEVWTMVLFAAHEQSDLRPLAQLLEAGVPLPKWVSHDLAQIFKQRQLQPRRRLEIDYRRQLVLHAKKLYDAARAASPGETAEQTRRRVLNQINNKLPKPWQVSDKSLLREIGGRSRLAGVRQRAARTR